MFAAPVLEDRSKANTATSSVHLEPLTVVLVVCVVLLSVVAVVLACIVYRRRRANDQRLVIVDEDRDSPASSLRTRLSPLHSNLLYAATSDDDKVKSGHSESAESGGGLLFAGGPTRVSVVDDGELSSACVEAVKSPAGAWKGRLFVEGPTRVMSGAGGRRPNEPTQSVLEYEIPFDPQWEFPRDRYDTHTYIHLIDFGGHFST